MTVLRLERLSAGSLEAALAELPSCLLWRCDAAIHLRFEGSARAVGRALAFAGVRSVEIDAEPPVPAGELIRALGMTLDPVPLGEGELDTLEVRTIGVAEATARILRRPPFAPRSSGQRRERCRALLRGLDLELEVRRTVWCRRASLRAARRSMRPAIFDRRALAPALRSRASEGLIGRWLTA